MIGLLETTSLAFVLLAAMVWAVVAVVPPALQSSSLAPAARSARARLWLYAPIWLPTLLVVSSILPGLSAMMFGTGDHCAVHAGHLHHLCPVHPPHMAGHPLVVVLIGVVLIPCLVVVARAAVGGVSEWRLGVTLARCSRESAFGCDVRLLDSRELVALTVGVLCPTVVLSTELVHSVPAGTLDVVVAHERAHARRRDGAWALVDSLAASILPRRVRNHWLHELALAREQACDLAAAESGGRGGRLRVAAALVEVAKLRLSSPSFGMSVIGTSVETRVRFLLGDSSRSLTWIALPVLCAVVAVVLGVGPVHHVIEHVSTHLLH
jgi:Zn-dependent protease with chaperone function